MSRHGMDPRGLPYTLKAKSVSQGTKEIKYYSEFDDDDDDNNNNGDS